MNRNLIFQCSDPLILEKLLSEKIVFYFGIDPTAQGIHLGHLLSIQLARDLISLGHEAIILVGGFTGTIGDPTGKSETRKLIDKKDTEVFANDILSDIRNIFKDSALYVNNKDWLDKMSLRDFLELSRYISVNKKLTMETFSNRIQQEQHLSMSEFLYPELQFFDFWFLNKKYDCKLQLGGGDQWGNICFGTHYLKKLGKEAYAISTPLLTDNGKKISKTDEKVPFLKNYRKMYHYCLNMTDSLATGICNIFQIETFSDPILTKKNIFKFVYSIYPINESLESIENEESQIFYGDVEQAPSHAFITVKEKDIISILKNVGGITRSEAQRQLSQNAIYIDGQHFKQTVLPNKFKLSIGKKKHFFIEIIS